MCVRVVHTRGGAHGFDILSTHTSSYFVTLFRVPNVLLLFFQTSLARQNDVVTLYCTTLRDQFPKYTGCTFAAKCCDVFEKNSLFLSFFNFALLFVAIFFQFTSPDTLSTCHRSTRRSYDNEVDCDVCHVLFDYSSLFLKRNEILPPSLYLLLAVHHLEIYFSLIPVLSQ